MSQSTGNIGEITDTNNVGVASITRPNTELVRDDASSSAALIGPQLASGTVLNERFQLERLLGQGGMGEVWLGRDQVLQRPVAAKFIRPADAELRQRTRLESGFRESFINEARIGANLSHPAIATVFDFGFFEGEPFIIFEYIAGETLQAVISRRGRLDAEDTCAIVGPLAQALDFAHARQIIHRDLKPDNIRSTLQGNYKILDLGLAKAFGPGSDWSSFAGTPAYTSPEQAAGQPCDGRCDQYSLALIAYELLTGKRPFQSTDWRELLRMQIQDPVPDPQVEAPNLSERVSEALLKALAKNVNDRFESCEAFASAIGCHFLNEPVARPEVKRVSRVRIKTRQLRLFADRALRRAYAGLTGDSLWITDGNSFSCIPLGSIVGVERIRSTTLLLHLSKATKEVPHGVGFLSANECDGWEQELNHLLGSRSQSASAAAGWQHRGPIVLLGRPPSIRNQILGPVEWQGESRELTSAALALQAAAMGGDAIVNLESERLPGLGRTLHRQSGVSIRVVDATGRRELALRWFNSEIGQLSLWMLALIGSIAVLEAPNWFSQGFRLADTISFLIVYVWPGIQVGVARVSRWPETVRPAALTVLGLGSIKMAGSVGAMVTLLEFRKFDGLWVGVLTQMTVGVLLFLFAWYLFRRAWNVRLGHSLALGEDIVLVSPGRKRLGWGLWAVAWLYFGAAVIGAAWWGYQEPYLFIHSHYEAAARKAAAVHAPAPAITNPSKSLTPVQVEAMKAYKSQAAGETKMKQIPPAATEAEVSFRDAVAKWEEVTRVSNAQTGYQIGLATATFELAVALWAQNRHQDAEPYLKRAVSQLDSLEKAFPTVQHQDQLRSNIVKLLKELATERESQQYFAAAQMMNDGVAASRKIPPDLSLAETKFRSALQQWKQLIAADRQNPEFRVQLAFTYYDLGVLLATTGKREDAVQALRKAAEQQDRLEREFPKYPRQAELRSRIHKYQASMATLQ